MPEVLRSISSFLCDLKMSNTATMHLSDLLIQKGNELKLNSIAVSQMCDPCIVRYIKYMHCQSVNW